VSVIVVSNHGPLILSSNFWESEYAAAGKLYVSVNAGTIRILVPQSNRELIAECRKAKYAILSRGPWPAAGLPEAVEILLEDGSDSPYSLHLSPTSFDQLPAEPPEGREWLLTIWTLKSGRAHKSVERICHWRRVASLPWLKPWE
jgi:hypothetical protein